MTSRKQFSLTSVTLLLPLLLMMCSAVYAKAVDVHKTEKSDLVPGERKDRIPSAPESTVANNAETPKQIKNIPLMISSTEREQQHAKLPKLPKRLKSSKLQKPPKLPKLPRPSIPVKPQTKPQKNRKIKTNSAITRNKKKSKLQTKAKEQLPPTAMSEKPEKQPQSIISKIVLPQTGSPQNIPALSESLATPNTDNQALPEATSTLPLDKQPLPVIST